MIPPVWIDVRAAGKWIPVPFLLLWPLVLVALVVAQVALPFVPLEDTTAGQRALMPIHLARLLGALRGLRVDVEAADGTQVHVRII